MPVKYAYFDREYEKLERVLIPKIQEVLKTGSFILRNEVSVFEERIAKKLGVNYCVGLNSGTDALLLGILACDFEKGHEVILPAHSFASTVFAVLHAGLIPKFVDVGDDHNLDVQKIHESLTKKTCAILCIHMNGVPCNMQAINELAEEYGIAVLEDAAQSFGSKLGAQSCGSFGKFAAFSLHPLKTLNVAGDGGFLTTNSKTLARKVLALRNIGQEEKGIHSLLGFNSRLDNIQAAIANIKLDYFETAINRRSQIAERYRKGLKETQIQFPRQSLTSESEVASNFSNFVIMVTDRDKLREELTLSGIETLIAWDPPIYQSDFVKIKSNSDFPNTERIAKQSLNLPINQYMMDSEIDEVILNINRFLC